MAEEKTKTDVPLPGPEKPARPEGAFTDNYLKEMESVPLFMNSLPEDADENPMLQALQSLMYDGPPEGKRSYRVSYIRTGTLYYTGEDWIADKTSFSCVAYRGGREL